MEYTVYGPTLLGSVGKNGHMCSMHAGPLVRMFIDKDIGVDDGVFGGVPLEVAKVVGAGEFFFEGPKCRAEEGVLVRDRRFAQLAKVMSVPGFAYCSEQGLDEVSSYGRGSPIGNVPRGYSYLNFVRQGFQRRVARVLGPRPLVADVCAVLRLVGRKEVSFDMVFSDWGASVVSSEKPIAVRTIVHRAIVELRRRPYCWFAGDLVDDGYCYTVANGLDVAEAVKQLGKLPTVEQVVRYVLPKVDLTADAGVKIEEVGSELLHLKRVKVGETYASMLAQLLHRVCGNFSIRVGSMNVGQGKVDEMVQHVDDGDGDRFRPVGHRGKAACGRCGRVVNPVDHECVVREKKFCDKCKFIVVAEGHEQRCSLRLTKNVEMELLGDAMHGLDVKLLATMYCKPGEYSIEASKLMDAKSQKKYLVQLGVDIGRNHSDHAWGSEFERRYFGEFRRTYIRWVCCYLAEEFGDPNALAVDIDKVVDDYDLRSLLFISHVG